MHFTELAMASGEDNETVEKNLEYIKAFGSKRTNVEKAYRGKTWSESVTRTLIQIWGDETIQIALSSCKSSKESSQVYKSLLVSSAIFRLLYCYC